MISHLHFAYHPPSHHPLQLLSPRRSPYDYFLPSTQVVPLSMQNNDQLKKKNILEFYKYRTNSKTVDAIIEPFELDLCIDQIPHERCVQSWLFVHHLFGLINFNIFIYIAF